MPLILFTTNVLVLVLNKNKVAFVRDGDGVFIVLIKTFAYKIIVFPVNGLFDSNSSLGFKKITRHSIDQLRRLSMIVRVNIVLKRTVVVDSD